MAFVECEWHDHPLQISSILSDAQSLCFVCSQSATGYNYRCPDCNYFIHITCLNLPLQSLHPLHPHHPLTLLRDPPPPNHHHCDHCKSPLSGFTYHCPLCSFSLHLPCALQPHAFQLEIHKHPLTFFASPPSGHLSFRCYVCGDRGYGFNLACKACDFEVHVECSAVPVTLSSNRHRHSFCLTSVRSIDDGSDEFYCDIVCEGEVNSRGCVYYCAECEYMAHLGCLTSAPKHDSKLAYKEVRSSDISNLPKSRADQNPFPVLSIPQMGQIDDEDLTKLRHRFAELLNKDQSNQPGQSVELSHTSIKHFSHNHGLELSSEHKERKVTCHGCWERIQGLAYTCTQCNFFLHQWCAKLPRKIQHPLHPDPAHSLNLVATSPNHTQCNACNEPCDGFTFVCQAKYCFFTLHAMCASIPSTLSNEIHQHPLVLRRKIPYSTQCKACVEDCTGTVFECERCDLQLDFRCALLPHKVRHRCHVDLLTLTSIVEEDDSDEFYCDACEKRRDPKPWVYHCADCLYSAHMTCVVPDLLGGRPANGLLQYNHHEHLLGLITKSS